MALKHCGLGSHSNHGLVSCLPHLLHAYLHIVLLSSCLCLGHVRLSVSDKSDKHPKHDLFPSVTWSVWQSAYVCANGPLVSPFPSSARPFPSSAGYNDSLLTIAENKRKIRYYNFTEIDRKHSMAKCRKYIGEHLCCMLQCLQSMLAITSVLF